MQIFHHLTHLSTETTKKHVYICTFCNKIRTQIQKKDVKIASIYKNICEIKQCLQTLLKTKREKYQRENTLFLDHFELEPSIHNQTPNEIQSFLNCGQVRGELELCEQKRNVGTSIMLVKACIFRQNWSKNVREGALLSLLTCLLCFHGVYTTNENSQSDLLKKMYLL